MERVHGMDAFHVGSSLVFHELIYCCNHSFYALSFHIILVGPYGSFLFYIIPGKDKAKDEGGPSSA